ncbi:integrative and conjugative element protein (TIGR02256 family) [Brevibacillus aydinogluensis]|jgi:integrative and conjugative element protein (TIGR02256 family)|uniref:Prok-JAB domain-containing protein n=1 Tax=Brevibacillus aydinogluensis TaxID=927786 RepID=A0AA48RF02_9BACL|nr:MULTISPECIES: Mov34/MPN/PAD-1 family protein [Brevibacillus]MBR8659388.1 Mov34/MPN/PAD-1 family protein [Brevibacillus sp. NL20B1]MDT3414447.1 integrative and conjugative element protein (TIGR02256 family) [Brevibacillus aydinogluensis]REK64572.1 MAG: hypothetical protein DF221_07720 [Brevibacillus sp.]CAJ1003334.1 Prok-JAB domain-containing protein [Brevibacillus aydinogluensis]
MTSLYITPKAWKQIELSVRNNPSLETGGILMGYALNDKEWLITYASDPGPKAVRHPNAILFDDDHLRRLVRKLSRRQRWQYIGDWHSHTIKRLTPSKGDRRTIWTKANQSLYMSSSPIMLIVGLNRQDKLQARAFILENSLREVEKIELATRRSLRQRDGKSP